MSPFSIIPGLLLRTYWTPISKGDVAIPIKRPAVANGCKEQCSKNEKCCQWGVRAVRDWEDAQEFAVDVDVSQVTMAWQIDGPEKAGDFKGVEWCTDQKCVDDGTGLDVSVSGQKKDKLRFNFKFAPKDTKLPLTDFPRQQHGSSFYVLVVLDSKGYHIYNKEGELKLVLNTKDGVDFVVGLAEVEDEGDAATWLKAWICGLYEKKTRFNKIKLVSDEANILPRCLHPHESVVDEDDAKELVNARTKAAAKKWSDDVQGAGNSRGIAFASIACAVFASVSLIYVILAVKNSRLQVSAEE